VLDVTASGGSERRLLLGSRCHVISVVALVLALDPLMSLTTSLTVADLVFALLDHLDSGTHFELGYARKEGTPVIGYADNLETSSETMILGSGCEVYDDLSSAGPLLPVFSESRG